MTYLKYYSEENKHFPKEFEVKYQQEDIQIFFKKFQQKYKFRQELKLYGKRETGRCSLYRIKIPYECSIGLLIHEIGHAIQFKKDDYVYIKGKRFHNKQHLNIMKRIFKYWNDNREEWIKERERQQQRKYSTKINKELRQQELKDYKKTSEYKIKNLQDRKKRLLTKKKRLDTLLKKIERSLNYHQKKTII